MGYQTGTIGPIVYNQDNTGPALIQDNGNSSLTEKGM